MSQAVSISTKKSYGLARVCRVWNYPRSTVYEHRQRAACNPQSKPRRRGPVGACPDEEMIVHIRTVLDESPFHGEGHRKVRAMLRFKGIGVSKDRTLRLMGEHGLLAPHRVGKPRGPRVHDGTIRTEKPDVMWGTDLTETVTVTEGRAHVFAAVDHCTGECLGIHAAMEANRFEALEPIRQGVRSSFGVFSRDVAAGLSIRHDHGSQYQSRDFQEELRFLGIQSSPSFVRAPEGNGIVERFFRTLKENLLWIQPSATLEALRKALREFQQQYNEQWMLERHGYKSPSQVRASFQHALALAA